MYVLKNFDIKLLIVHFFFAKQFLKIFNNFDDFFYKQSLGTKGVQTVCRFTNQK